MGVVHGYLTLDSLIVVSRSPLLIRVDWPYRLQPTSIDGEHADVRATTAMLERAAGAILERAHIAMIEHSDTELPPTNPSHALTMLIDAVRCGQITTALDCLHIVLRQQKPLKRPVTSDAVPPLDKNQPSRKKRCIVFETSIAVHQRPTTWS